MALFDISVEIIIMIKKVIKNAVLAMKQRPKLELVLHTSYNRLFQSLCKDVSITINGLKIRHRIFIMEIGVYYLVLKQPFFHVVQFSQDYKLNVVFEFITHF